MDIWIYVFVSILAVSLISLAGVFTLSLSRERLNKIVHYLVSFAVGSLFGNAFIHLLPEVFSQSEESTLLPAVYIPVGILIFFILEKFIRWRHCHNIDCNDHPEHLIPINLFGDSLHNFIDGLIIGAAYHVNIQVGIATTVAVLFHELPQEIGDFGVLIHGGLSVKKALTFNFLTALTSFLGAAIAVLAGQNVEGFVKVLIPVTAGGFIYIAGSDLIPELHHHEEISKSIGQLIFIVLGLAVMIVLKITY